MGNRNKLLVASTIVLLAMLAASAWAWTVIPDGARIPIHWNAAGQIDGYGGKTLALLIAPVAVFVLSAILAVLPAIEPRRQHFIQSSKFYAATWLGILALMSVVHALVILAGTGIYVGSSRLGLAGVGVMLIVMGNYLGKVRSNFFMGIRTPWTLSSELSWRKTHRLGGWLFIAIGLMIIVTTFAAPNLLPTVLVVGILGMVLVVFIYSYIVWRNDPNRRAGDSTSPAE